MAKCSILDLVEDNVRNHGREMPREFRVEGPSPTIPHSMPGTATTRLRRGEDGGGEGRAGAEGLPDAEQLRRAAARRRDDEDPSRAASGSSTPKNKWAIF